MKRKEKYTDFKVAYDLLWEHSPSVFIYTPILWVLKVLLWLLAISSLVFFLSTFSTLFWGMIHDEITGNQLRETDSLRILMLVARIGFLTISILSWMALKFSQLALRRNWFIFEIRLFTEELLSHIDKKEKEAVTELR